MKTPPPLSASQTSPRSNLWPLLALLLALTAQLKASPTTQPAIDQKTIDAALGTTGELKDNVYALTIPRSDLHLTIEGADVPTAAGIESRFYFYTCPCGKTRVIGEFVLCDYESNDVIDSLREGDLLSVDAIAPMLTDDRPHLRIVRFHGEGSAEEVGRHLHDALQHVGEARIQKQK